MEKKDLNHIVKEKLKEVEHKIIPGIQWNKQESWNKIKDILSTKNKQLIMWYFATAASVSILVAATLDDTLPAFEQYLPESESAAHASNEQEQIPMPLEPLKANPVPDPADFTIQPRSYDEPEPAYMMPVCIMTEKATPEAILAPEQPSSTAAPRAPFGFNFNVSSNQLSGFAPGVEFQYRHVLKKNTTQSSFISISTHTSLILSQSEEAGQSRLYPATFVNASYGKAKYKSNKTSEWEIGAGYLLNPNQVIYKDTTIRFHYTRSVLGRLKIGPELIWTNNLTKIYPGITLAFG